MTEPVFITKDGTLERHENTLYFENEFQKNPIPIEQIDEIYCTSHVTISSGAIHMLAKKEIPVHFFNHYGFYESSLWPRKKAVSGNITILQAKAYINPEVRFQIASSFVLGAALNMNKSLKAQERNKNDVAHYMEEIISLTGEIPDVSPSIPRLMGIEGNIRKMYYEALDMILPEWLMIRKREFHPPSNPGNAVMSFLNSLAYSACLTEIYYTQLEPSISFLHEPGTLRFSLSLDLAEIFKPAVTDRIFLKVANRGELNSSHFDSKLGNTILSESGKRFILKSFQEKLGDSVMHKGLKRKVTYRFLMRLESYKILNFVLLGEIYKPLVSWW
jgi:CRISPR-associated protein Cas1